MKRVLSVAAVIDTPTPAAWSTQLLDRLMRHPRVELTVVLPLQASSGVDQRPVPAAPTGIPGSLARHVLRHLIDKPLVKQDPWRACALPSTPELRVSKSLPTCDVVLNLTAAALQPSVLPTDGTPVWDAHLETLAQRVEQALVTQAPLVWVHLWSHERTADADHTDLSALSTHDRPLDVSPESNNDSPLDDTTPVRIAGTVSATCRRLASHALPRQSYSLTDLQRTAWFCLPALFESRLNWLSCGADPCEMEYTESAEAPTQFLDPELHAARLQAEALRDKQFLPAVFSPVAYLSKVMCLWKQQSVERIRNRLWYEQWQLAVLKHTPPTPANVELQLGAERRRSLLSQLTDHALSEYLPIDMPDHTWWADPHLFRHEDKLYVFFEEMGIKDTYGHLAVAHLTDEGQLIQTTTILDEGVHLSYPFVFECDSDIYMIPETVSKKAVQLYKADEFPNRWSQVCTLLDDVDYADSTVHYDGQQWWMFTSAMSHRSINERDELHLYHAATLTGPWHAHPMNPVVTGVDRARMAGRLFSDGSHLYRASQYGAWRYGFGINLHRVNRLDEQAYSETTAGRITPQPGSRWLACHSLSHTDDVTVLDRVIRRRR